MSAHGALTAATLASAGLLLVVAVVVLARWPDSSGVARHRLAWLASAVVVSIGATLVGGALNVLFDWPGEPGAGLLVALVALPVAWTLGLLRRVDPGAERVLVVVVVATGLSVMTAVVYVLVVVGFDSVPEGSEQEVLALSMIAAASMAVLGVPASRALHQWATARVFGSRRSAAEVLEEFSQRMTRALPEDELMLQLVESLRRALSVSSAEVWVASGQHLARVVSLPDRGPARHALGDAEMPVVIGARAQGRKWLSIWLPALLEDRPENAHLRSVPVAHLGELLGLIVLERPEGEDPFSDTEDEVMVDLARRLGLALHNARLDRALQASLEQVQRRNVELAASRARIVAAADESRLAIERNLHDGAQQHLVALAVKLGLVNTLIESDPRTAKALLAELSDDVQRTIGELRELARGIYPPLLRERGLPEALRAAAARHSQPVDVETHLCRRYPAELEAAVYFCCTEALQNAAKHAEDARVRVRVGEEAGGLCLEVSDDGPGFDPATVSTGRGLLNMGDRLGALGGEVSVTSAPGQGTTVRGEVPLQHRVDEGRDDGGEHRSVRRSDGGEPLRQDRPRVQDREVS